MDEQKIFMDEQNIFMDEQKILMDEQILRMHAASFITFKFVYEQNKKNKRLTYPVERHLKTKN